VPVGHHQGQIEEHLGTLTALADLLDDLLIGMEDVSVPLLVKGLPPGGDVRV